MNVEKSMVKLSVRAGIVGEMNFVMDCQMLEKVSCPISKVTVDCSRGSRSRRTSDSFGEDYSIVSREKCFE